VKREQAGIFAGIGGKKGGREEREEREEREKVRSRSNSRSKWEMSVDPGVTKPSGKGKAKPTRNKETTQ